MRWLVVVVCSQHLTENLKKGKNYCDSSFEGLHSVSVWTEVAGTDDRTYSHHANQETKRAER